MDAKLEKHDEIPSARKPETAGSCPLPQTHRRLSHAHRLWHLAQAAYMEPDDFILHLNSAVEALRNVTFILQNEMKVIPEADKWYQGWRDRMSDSAGMKWLQEARTKVVHKGDLATHSMATIRLHKDWFGPQETGTVSVPPFLQQPELAMALAQHLDLSQLAEKTGFLEVERRWIEDGLPEFEILMVLASCYGYLWWIVAHAHARLGWQIDEVFGDDHTAIPRADLGFRPPCMALEKATRTAYLDIRTLKPVGAVVSAHQISSVEPWAAKQLRDMWPVATGHIRATRENPDEVRDTAFNRQAAAIFELAKQKLVEDEHIVTTAYIYTPVGHCQKYVFHESDMYLAMRVIAGEMKLLGADQLLFVTELWLGSSELRVGELPSELSSRREALGCFSMSARGPDASEQWCVLYTRDAENKPRLEEELSNPKDIFPQFLLPVFAMWEGLDPDARAWPKEEPGSGKSISPLPLNTTKSQQRDD